MRVWSVQPLELYEKLKRDGVLHCDIELSECAGERAILAAYDWMCEQMRNRIELPPKGARYPFWAWHTVDWKHKKPDLRRREFRNRCRPAVCLELEIPENQILLSDMENWHVVLNDGFFCCSNSQADYDRVNAWFEALPPDRQQDAKLKSWENIFDITPAATDWLIKGRYIQATFWELNLNQIVSVRHFCQNSH